MRFELTILGANSAIPSFNRFPSSQILNIGESNNLIDCGEGAQIKLMQFRIGKSRIDRVFISHMHGDHIFGLPGLLTSMRMAGRERALAIYGPVGISDFLHQILEHSGGMLTYELDITEIHPEKYEKITDSPDFEVFGFPLKHRLPTSGFLFKEKKKPLNIRKEAIEKYGLTIDQIKQVKKGRNVLLDSGREIDFRELTHPPKKRRAFAYCSDTIYDESIIPYIHGAELLYHEATYLHDMAAQARERMHSTAREAAMIARKAKIGKLIIGHYSGRYRDLNPLLQEAREVFDRTELAIEGMRFELAESHVDRDT